MKEILRQFMLTPAPSGYEGEMAHALKEKFLEQTSEVKLSRMGNVIAHFKGTDKDAPRVMVFAHMDQLGFIVRKIENDGFIQVDRMGGIPEKVLPGLNVCVRTEDGNWIDGIFGPKAHHATSADEKYKVDPITTLFIDIGAKSRDEVKSLGIDVGCPAIYRPAYTELKNGMISGTAVDNRGSCACLVEIAKTLRKQPPTADTYLVGTVWEEFNIRGAVFAAREIKPDIAIGLDVTLAGDTHDLASRYETKLGLGPVANLYSFHGRGTLNGTLAHEPLYKLVKETAKMHQIPFQRFAGIGLLTDLAYVQMEGQGVAALDIGFPARYTHTPVESACLKDLEAMSALVAATIQNINKNFKVDRF
jgi:putative aminopeptidase FrvX